MNGILSFLASQNSFLSGFLVAAFAALVAFGVIKLAALAGHRSRIIYFIVIPLFVIGSLVFTPSLLEERKQVIAIPEKVDELKQYKVIAVIFKNYPEEEKSLREIIAKTKTPEEADQMIMLARSQLIDKYFYPNLVKAPDNLVTQYIILTSQIMHELEPLPISCYEYFAGSSSWRTESKIPATLLDEELRLKGDIIEAGLKNTNPVELDTIEVAMNNIYIKYSTNKYDTRELQYLSGLDKIQPEDACKIALHFTDTVVSMGDDGAQAMKSLINFQISAK
jgi:hypothetical protein